jgi:hypothetical protein
MAIRLPLKNVGTFTAAANETGAGSTAGGIAYSVTLPQDTDGVVVKFTASVVSGGYSAVFQTTDDGGTTWYDCGRTSIVTNANGTTAEWLNIPVVGNGVGTATVQTTASVYTASIGKAAASALSGNRMSGLPVLSQQARVFVRITSDITDAAANTYTAQVLVNSQSATA